MSINIFDEYEAAKQRGKWTDAIIASRIHVTQGAITNWKARGSIPSNQLISIAALMHDYDFSAACSEFTYGVRVHSEARVQDTPYAKFFQQRKEEHDRKQLDETFTILQGKLPIDRTAADCNQVKRYCREFLEEIESENSYVAAVMRDWNLTIEEVK